jgi:hypothetical protein
MEVVELMLHTIDFPVMDSNAMDAVQTLLVCCASCIFFLFPAYDLLLSYFFFFYINETHIILCDFAYYHIFFSSILMKHTLSCATL